MKLGGEYQFRNIQLRPWRRQAEELRVDADELVKRVFVIANELADDVPAIDRPMTDEGLTHPLIRRPAGRLITREAACRRVLRE